MRSYELETDQMIREIAQYVQKFGDYPPRGYLSKNGKDIGKALTRYRTGEVFLTQKQVEMLAMIDDFLSRTEKNIQEIEEYYKIYGCIPVGEENRRLVDVISSYKSGKVPISPSQRERLERIGVLISNTERMMRAIEAFYEKYGRLPRRGDKTPEGYDMGNAIIGYRNGKRMVTLAQMCRLEAIGVDMSKALIKDEPNIQIREIAEKNENELSMRIQKLKKEKESMIDSFEEQKKIL